jgi:two-component system, chemotaxis family, protein-glutamate methylesterase/glutaminase
MNRELPKSPIRVFVVDDSAFMRAAVTRMIVSDPDLLVVATAASGTEALQRIVSLDPDVITLDVQMPGLDGLETLRRIMAEFPRPVIMVSSTTLKDAEITFTALAAGAFDYVPKQLSPTSLDIRDISNDLVAKIKAAAESRYSREHFVLPRKPPRAVNKPVREFSLSPIAIVALGISTGGPRALEQILPALPGDLPVPVLVVQHMPAGFSAPFAKRLNQLCAISVCEASHGKPAQRGVVYIAPAGSQLTVERTSDKRTLVCLSNQPEKQLHAPSADITMQSVAAAFHSQAMGVIMTGMGSDGARGMSAIHREGGFTVGQDEASCAVYGMPRVCAEMGILDRVVPLARIPDEILRAARYRKTNVS